MRRLLATLVLVAACKASGTFTCEDSDQCRGGATPGTCEPSGYCGFADPSCPSGERYDPYAGAGLGDQCVGDENDGGVDAPAICASWHPHQFQPCGLGSPMTDLHLMTTGSPYTYDTTSEGGDLRDSGGTVLMHSPLVIQQTDGSSVAVLSVASVQIDTSVKLNVIGTKPLIIASWSTLAIAGLVDVGSHTTETDATAPIQRSTRIGAGADLQCTALAGIAGVDAVATGGSGGGGGGAFQGPGGAGAVGDTGCTSTPCPRPGGPGGIAVAAAPAVIRGGCSGAASGAGGPGVVAPATATSSSAGGAGGGALQLAARVSITISGTVTAGGAAGAGAPTGSACGGGGGGAGGYIGLDAPTVTVSGTIAANGAGGGGSAPFSALPNFGNVGNDGAASAVAAAGGAANTSGTCGLAGAAGAAASMLGGTTATGNDTCGGGGGGGGAGFILYWAQSFSGAGSVTLSPPALAGP